MSGDSHRARKRFGQHFLVDDGVINAIVRAIDPKPGDHLIEIGPGLGALTHPLLARGQPLTVIELDRDLAARWRAHGGVTVIESDVLKVDFAALAPDKVRVVGNLPYNISTPILFHLLASIEHVQDQHFMLQKEVVDRMAAAPGSKTYGRLSVMLQWRYQVEPLFDVPPESFDPPPKVDSAIVRMRPKPAAEVAGIDVKRLGEIVTLAFSQRRKMLRQTLGAWAQREGLSTPFDFSRRAEAVPVEDYIALSQAVGATPSIPATPATPASAA